MLAPLFPALHEMCGEPMCLSVFVWTQVIHLGLSFHRIYVLSGIGLQGSGPGSVDLNESSPAPSLQFLE